MSEPQYDGPSPNQNPRPRLTPVDPPTRHGNHPGQEPRATREPRTSAPRSAADADPGTWPSAARGRAHGNSRALPGPADSRTAGQRDDWLLIRHGEHPLSLTWEEIHYFVRHDPDQFFDPEELWRDVEFDRAIDREPEIE
jgi:hypothetical protein